MDNYGLSEVSSRKITPADLQECMDGVPAVASDVNAVELRRKAEFYMLRLEGDPLLMTAKCVEIKGRWPAYYCIKNSKGKFGKPKTFSSVTYKIFYNYATACAFHNFLVHERIKHLRKTLIKT